MNMNKKLNNKGMTLIEIIVCFVVVVVIVLAMFKTVNNYKDKQDIESYKSSIMTYKNTITKVIWDDIIARGGMIGYEDLTSQYTTNEKVVFAYKLKFRNDTSTLLKILHNVIVTDDVDRIDMDCTDDVCSEFYIQYGEGANEERFNFPGLYNVQFNNPKINEVTCTASTCATNTEKGSLFHIYVGVYNPDLQIGDQYTILDIYTPNVSDYYYALGGY